MVNFNNIQKLHRRDVLHDRFHAQRFINDNANRLHNLIYVSRNIINNRLLVISTSLTLAVLSLITEVNVLTLFELCLTSSDRFSLLSK